MPHEAVPNEQRISTDKKLDELYELTRDIETAMFTTRRPDGRLVSRAMATQRRESGADFWFVTSADSDKLDELAFDSHVNLAYYRNRTREWVSVSGIAWTSADPARVRALYQLEWKAWFPDEGGERTGGPDDPRIVLVGVDAESAVYFKVDRPRPLVLFDIAKAMVTGTPPDVGEIREISERGFDRYGEMKGGQAAARRSGVLDSDSPEKRR